MRTSKVKYLGELRCESNHSGSGQTVISDAPVDNHGKGQAFSPTDMVANSLATCMITIMGICANDNQLDITGTEASVTKVMSKEKPRRIVEIKIEIEIPNLQLDSENRNLLEKVARNCPVALSLSKEIKQDILFKYS